MDAAMAEALAEFRAFNYEQIYMRPASVAQGEAVVRVLRALVEFYADRPNTLPFPELAGSGHPSDGARAGSDAGAAGGGHVRRGHDRPVRVHPGAWPISAGTRRRCPPASTSRSAGEPARDAAPAVARLTVP